MPAARLKPLLRSRLIRLLVTAGLLVLVALRVDVAGVGRYLAGVSPLAFLQALGLGFLAYWGRAVRWQLLLDRAGIAVSPVLAYRLTLVGVFYGIFTPGRAGELAKVAHLGRPASRSLPSVFWERISDVLLLEILAVPWFLAHGTGSVLTVVYLAMTAATLGILVLGSHPSLPARVGGRWPRVRRWTEHWTEGSSGMLRSRAFHNGMAAGILFYVVNFLGAFLLARSLSPGVGGSIVTLFPVIILLGNLPIAFGGLGLREAVAAAAFAGAGLDPAAGPALSLLWFAAVTLVPGTAGYLLHQTGALRSAGPSREREPSP